MKTSDTYKEILKDVLKNQIQVLIEQLCSQAGIDSILMTSDRDGLTISSNKGKAFLVGREHILEDFCRFCSKVTDGNSLITVKQEVSRDSHEINQDVVRKLRVENSDKKLSGYQLMLGAGDFTAEESGNQPFPPLCEEKLENTQNHLEDTADHTLITNMKKKNVSETNESETRRLRVRKPNKPFSGYNDAEECTSVEAEDQQIPVVVEENVQDAQQAEEALKNVKTCVICGYTTKYPSNLKRHLHSRHQIGDREIQVKMFRCYYCPYCSKIKCNMVRHLRKLHNVEITSENIEEHASVTVLKDGNSRMSLDRSLNSTDSAGFSDFEDSRPDAVVGKRRWNNIAADDSVTDEMDASELAENDSELTGKRRKVGNECNYCHASFAGLDELKKHIDVVHFGTDDKRFTCETCGREFKNEFNYRGHLASHHSSYSCVCGTSFNSRWHVRKHKACCKIARAGLEVIRNDDSSNETSREETDVGDSEQTNIVDSEQTIIASMINEANKAVGQQSENGIDGAGNNASLSKPIGTKYNNDRQSITNNKIITNNEVDGE